MSNVFNKPSVLIVGGGEFGATTAVELLRCGNYSSVTIIDRAESLPALDAASTDINKVVRFDYADNDYAQLAREAVRRWNKPEWKGVYFETGCIIRGLTDVNSPKIYENARRLEPGVRLLTTPEEVRERLSPSGKAVVGDKALIKSYWNPSAGWAHASAAVTRLYEEITRLGGKLVPSAELQSLILTEDGPGGPDVRGVRCTDGREFLADKVILALGSWTGGHPALRGLLPDGLLVPTGQTVAAVQLNKEEQEQYKDMPTIANLEGSGYYSFPPNQDGLVKFALHQGGYLVPSAVPRTAADPQAVAYNKENGVGVYMTRTALTPGWIPAPSFKLMRDKFAELYPELAKKPMAFTRMCWYSDTPDGNFVIDYAPQYPSLLIASGGAGHGFKFLPVLGELIHARLEGRLAPHLQQKWAISRLVGNTDADREGRPGRQPFVLGDLATLETLGPINDPRGHDRRSKL